jgi:hypothetical protein
MAGGNDNEMRLFSDLDLLAIRYVSKFQWPLEDTGSGSGIPEASSFGMLASGLVGLFVVRRLRPEKIVQ